MPKKPDKTVPVLDTDNRFLSSTTPAKARMMLKDGKVSVFKKNPFIVQMNGELGELKMAKAKSKLEKSRTFIRNFTSYFMEEKEVYVQNMGSTNIQLTIQTNNEPIYISIAKSRKPMNLTQYVSFGYIKESSDFRKLINRNPPILQLLEEEEYVAYYEKMATREGTSVDEAMRRGQDIHDILMGKKRAPLNELQREMDQKLEEKEEALLSRKEPDPRVVGLCARADKDNDPGQRITAADFIEDLEILENELDLEDWEFVSTKGVYKTVKDFAMKQMSKAGTSTDDDE